MRGPGRQPARTGLGGRRCRRAGRRVGHGVDHRPRPGEFRGPDQLPGRAAGGGGAAVEDEPVRGRAGQPVGCLAQHHDGGTGAGEPADEVPDLDDAGSVQGGQRLVEHQHAGVRTTAQAMASRRSSPPERVAGSRSRRAARPVSSAMRATSRSMSGRAVPRFSRPKASSSATVERTVESMAAASCGT